MALEETNAKYTPVLVDVMNKPAYFTERINPLTGKVRHPAPYPHTALPHTQPPS